ncbi:hypothetical protein AB0C47_15575 [Micromonospora taraxaci]
MKRDERVDGSEGGVVSQEAARRPASMAIIGIYRYDPMSRDH